MRLIRRWLVVLISLFSIGMTPFASAENIDSILERGVLRVGVKSDVPGFGLRYGDGTYAGLEIDLAHRLAYAILGDGQAVEFVSVMAKTRGPLLDQGEIDVVLATFTIMPDRLSRYDFSRPYYMDAAGLLVRVDSGIKRFTDLDGKIIGVAQSSNTRQALETSAESLGISLEFAEFPTYPDIKEALDDGRVSCFAVDTVILAGYMDESVLLLPDLFDKQPYGAAMKRGNTELLSVMDELLSRMRAEGELDYLIETYSLPTVNWEELDEIASEIWTRYELDRDS